MNKQRKTGRQTVLQFIGVVVIFIFIVFAIWKGYENQSLNFWITSIIALGFAVGLALILHERAIELTLGQYISIKAAAEEVQTDAKEVAELKEEVKQRAEKTDEIIEHLTEQKEAADQRISELEELTSEVERLPDGRLKIGKLITGSASILTAEVDQAHKAWDDKQFKSALEGYEHCIEIYEESEKLIGDKFASVAQISDKYKANLYSDAAQLAIIQGEHVKALKWARIAESAYSIPEIRAILAYALLKNDLRDQANEFIKYSESQPGEARTRFMDTMKKLGFEPNP